jgi:epoxyqueuosine reductase QueG
MQNLRERIEEIAYKEGATLLNIASTNDFKDAPDGHHPTDLLPSTKSIIVIGMKYLDALVDSLPLGQQSSNNSSPKQDLYSGHNDLVSRELDRVALAIARFLESEGFNAYHQPASRGGQDRRILMGVLSLKHMAVKAGMGVFGRNSLLITPKFGPRMRLSAILTNAELQSDTPLEVEFCDKCSKICIAACPIKAIKPSKKDEYYEINKFACNTYLQTVPACAICLKVCPVGTQRIK